MKDKILILSIIIVLSLITLLPVNSLAKNRGTIALVMKALSNPFFIVMRDGAKEYAKKNKIPLEIYGTERETEIDRQIQLVENLISGKYGAIVIAPADSKKLVPVCKKALDNGIVVINIDNPFHEKTLQNYGISVPFVGSSNLKGASMVGQYLKHQLKGKGNVAIIEGIRGVENAELRKKGFSEAITSGSEIKVVASETANWHTDEAFTTALKIFQQYKNIDAVFTANDSMALGVIQALEMIGTQKRVWIGSYDNIEEVRSQMLDRRIHATIEQHPELMGAHGVELAYNALRGEKVPKYVQTHLDLITYESFGKKIGVSLADLKNPFFITMGAEIEKVADLHGIEVIVKDANNDEAQQLIDIQGFVQRQVDAIIVNPTHFESVSLGIEFANVAKIPVITVDRKASHGRVISHVASDNFAGGRMVGEMIADKIKRKGSVLELEGRPGTSAAHNRGQGFNKTLRDHKGIQITRIVADFEREKARVAVEQLIVEGKKFKAVFAHNDDMILGAIEAYTNTNTELPFLVGFDAIPEALEAISQGLLSATIAQDPAAMGRISIENVIHNLRGEKIPPTVLVNLKRITKR
ncbi:MAG: substrate-binding domain-containing protein [Deltaproteobacteria bacterium]|nr:substrate-binding domain-containing protein [Deltaproteobacteria bacterium]